MGALGGQILTGRWKCDVLRALGGCEYLVFQ